MRRLLFVAMLLPLAAHAGSAPDTDQWRACAKDTDCVLVKGLCQPAAVNAAYEKTARTFYKKQAGDASCEGQFWVTKKKIVRCRLNACESVAK